VTETKKHVFRNKPVLNRLNRGIVNRSYDDRCLRLKRPMAWRRRSRFSQSTTAGSVRHRASSQPVRRTYWATDAFPRSTVVDPGVLPAFSTKCLLYRLLEEARVGPAFRTSPPPLIQLHEPLVHPTPLGLRYALEPSRGLLSSRRRLLRYALLLAEPSVRNIAGRTAEETVRSTSGATRLSSPRVLRYVVNAQPRQP
jgi:hypothetical protein